MEVNKYIFREYDIRGKVEDDFPSEVVVNLGKAFGTFIKRVVTRTEIYEYQIPQINI